MNLDDPFAIPLERFLSSLEQRGYRPATVAAWRGSLRRFFEFVQSEGVNSIHVPLELCFSFRRALSEEGLRKSTIIRHERRMIEFYSWLVNEEI